LYAISFLVSGLVLPVGSSVLFCAIQKLQKTISKHEANNFTYFIIFSFLLPGTLYEAKGVSRKVYVAFLPLSHQLS